MLLPNVKILSILLATMLPVSAFAKVDLKTAFGHRDACLVISEINSDKNILEYNPERCSQRFSPCSSFKIAAALMAFESGILSSENQVIKWDGKMRERAEINRDQTPLLWMSNSAMWVTQWITPQLGEKSIAQFLSKFSYGNQDFSSGLTRAWQTSTLKISAYEQVEFIKKLWKGELPVSKKTTDLTKKVIFIKSLETRGDLYGKTGTGCLEGDECMSRSDKMIGWFVGVLVTGSKSYLFAANASDTKPERTPAGPRLRETTIKILKDIQLRESP